MLLLFAGGGVGGRLQRRGKVVQYARFSTIASRHVCAITGRRDIVSESERERSVAVLHTDFVQSVTPL